MAKAAKDEVIDGHVSSSQCKKAIEALMAHRQKIAKKKEDSELLGMREENVWLVTTVKTMKSEKKLKPHKIPIVHPLVDPRTESVCLITKDPQREYKDLLETHGIKFISRVVGIEKLKGKFKPFEARRMLLKENALFLADERVIPLLPGLLGKAFFKAKKQPIPVCLTRKDLKGELEHAISSTYMHQNQGTCTSIKIGTTSQTAAQVLDNLKSALPAVVKHIHGGWENVQSFNIKTNWSVSLPIWSCQLGEGDDARWGTKETAAAEADNDWSGFGGEDADKEDEVEDEVPKLSAVKPSSKGKKRSLEDDQPKPQKKAKQVEKKDGNGAEEKTENASKKPSSPEDTETRKKKSAKQKQKSSESEHSTAEPLKVKKADAKLASAVSEPLPSPASKITSQELKAKRASQSLDKKKEKVVKAKIGKAAKDAIVGKAVKARI